MQSRCFSLFCLKTHVFEYKTKRDWSFRVTCCFINVPVQELQTSRLLLPKGNFVYTLVHVRDSIPCRTTYIEYKSQGEDSSSFWETPPNSNGFHGKIFFFIVLRHRSWGVPFDEHEKLIFLQYKKKLIISGDIRNFIIRHQPWKSVKDHENKGKVHPFLRNAT